MSLNILFNKSAINSLVFIEFITVTQHPDIETFKKNDPVGFNLWVKSYKDNDDSSNMSPEEFYHKKSAFNPIFSKLVAYSAGMFSKDNHEKPVIKKFFAKTEQELLSQITTSFYKMYESDKILSGYNLINFHIPYYTKRFFAGSNFNKIIVKNNNGEDSYASFPLLITEQLISKPWEMKILDLMQVMKFGSYYNTSLKQLLYHFDIKEIDFIDKENLSEYYWSLYKEGRNMDIELDEHMSNICSTHTKAVIKVYSHLRNVL